jgi:hypothetical protein
MGRIFISHSSGGDRYAELVRDAVSSKLEACGHEVLLDKTRLEPGDEWRSVLYRWLAECDGAIVLLNDRALEVSSWLPRESTILLWRRALGSPVRIVPALLAGTRSNSSTEGWFRELLTLHVARIDAQGTGQEEAEMLAERIVGQVGDVTALPAVDAPIGMWLRDVAECLEDVSRDRLARAARRLHVRDDDWQALLPDGEIFLAHQLLTRPLDVEVVEAIADLARGLTVERLERLVSLIQSTWVDPEAARKLVAASRPNEDTVATALPRQGPGGQPERQALFFGINASLPGTLRRYIDRATCCAPFGYRKATPSGVFGEDVTRELLSQCERALRAALNVRGTRSIDDRDFDVRRVKRVFLIFDPEIASPVQLAEVSQTLHAKYPQLTLLMATGGQSQSWEDPAGPFPELQIVEPRLEGEAERDGDQLGLDLEDLVDKLGLPRRSGAA